MTNEDDPLHEVIELLRQHGFSEEANDLALQVSKLTSPNVADREEAGRAILDRCQPRWLGDLYLEGLSLQQWWGLLERSARLARRRTTPPGVDLAVAVPRMQFREIFRNDELYYSIGTNAENGEGIIRVTVTSVGWRDFYFRLTADEFASFASDPRSLDDLAERLAHDQGKRYYADRLVE